MKALSRPITYVDDWDNSQKLHFVFVESKYEILKSDKFGKITKLFCTTNMALATLHWKKYVVALERTGEYTLSDIEFL
jgi:hypothetical protein